MKFYVFIFVAVCSINNLARANPTEDIMSLVNENQYEHLKYYLLAFQEKELDKIINNNNYILHKAILNTRVSDDIIELLLDSGSDPNQEINSHWKRTKDGLAVAYKKSTAAHLAVIAKRSSWVFDLLRGFNTDFNKKDASGWSAVDLAKNYKLEAMINYFKQHKIL